MTFQHFPHTNAWGRKFDFAVKTSYTTIILTNIVDLESPMLYTNQYSALKFFWFWRRRFLRVFFYYIWAWRPSCSMAWNHSNILSMPFQSRSHRIVTEQVSAQLDQSLGRDVENWFTRWRLWWPSWIFDRLSFSYFVSIRRRNAPHEVSVQLDHSL